tara:strand:+ start:528 stop:1409 length:882 start_codon:yes stop_codon:yes gene_type:complete
MSNKVLVVTGSGGYILKGFDFNKFKVKYDIFYIKNKKINSLDITYSEKDLDLLIKKIIDNNYTEINLISFGSHLGGSDPGQYFKSVQNLENLLNKFIYIHKPIYIYHASSFSIFDPMNNSSLFSFLIKEKEDLRGAYSFSKKLQNLSIKDFIKNNELAKSIVVHIGHVYDKQNKLIFRFTSKSIRFYKFIFSFLYSPFKLINPTSVNSIHSDIKFFLESNKFIMNKYEEKVLTDVDSPISLFRVFMKEKFIFISPLSILICTISPFLLLFIPKNSFINFILRKYLQMNNSIRY